MLNEDELEDIPVKHGGKSKTPKPIDPNHYNKIIQKTCRTTVDDDDEGDEQ